MSNKQLCTDCKKKLPIENFYPHKDTKSGVYPYCKKCSSNRGKEYRQANKEKLSLYDKKRNKIRLKDPVFRKKVAKSQRNWVVNNREKHTARKLRWRKNNPLQVKAHTAVKDALRCGKLLKSPCKKCGAKEKLEAHHTDYSKPLKVMWLCRSCHIKIHMRLRNGKN